MLQVRITLQVRGVRVGQTGCARGVFSKLWLRARDRSVKYSLLGIRNEGGNDMICIIRLSLSSLLLLLCWGSFVVILSL